jgi:hypothetical protein
LQTKEGLSLRHVIQNTKICEILRATVGKTFDPLNGHHIPCNLVAHSMFTFPVPWDPRNFPTFDPLNGHHILCNLVAHNMFTFPVPWDPRIFFSWFCCLGLGV